MLMKASSLNGQPGSGRPEERPVHEGRGHDPAEQRSSRPFLGGQAPGADPPVAVPGLPALDPHGVEHAVAFHRVGVAAQRVEPRVGAIAYEHALEVRRVAPLDVKVGGVGLGVHGREAASERGDGRRVDYEQGWRRH